MPVGKSRHNKKRKIAKRSCLHMSEPKKPTRPVDYEALPQLQTSIMLAACLGCRSHNLANVTTTTKQGNEKVAKCGRCGKLHKLYDPPRNN